jgi:F-type H+-transporting ATPase subunit gamma
MPSLKAIRKRIGSVQNTQKITRAMKLVAAARLRRAQESIIAARPYARALEDVIAELARRAGAVHPLLAKRDAIKKVLLVAISSDRGLAGAYNTNINRMVERFIGDYKEKYETIEVEVVGRKARDYLRRRKLTVTKEHPGVNSAVALDRARDLAAVITSRYTSGEIDAVYLVYNEFKSAISQKVNVEQFLPVVPKELPAGAPPTDFIYEPSREEVLGTILPQYVEVEIYRALLEAIASEFGARMTAMDNATNNAKEMIARLTLDYNRARQAAITKELLEIIGGAEALKG